MLIHYLNDQKWATKDDDYDFTEKSASRFQNEGNETWKYS